MANFIGISFPFRKGSSNFPEVATDDDLIKQDLLQLVLTGAAERVMRPSFGSNVYAYVFEDNSELLQERIEAELTQLIGQFEPRVALLGVDVVRGDQANEAEATSITITISYFVLSTQQSGTANVTLSTNGAP